VRRKTIKERKRAGKHMTFYTMIDFDVSRDGVAIITLDRPEKHNAFNAVLINELADAFDKIAHETTIRLVILRGAGKSFSAGADLDWMKEAASYTVAENEADAVRLAEMLRKLHDLPQPTLALVQGAAIGGGAGLVAACDVVIAMASAKFRFSEVRLGLTPATISPFVVRAVGPRWAKALFVTAESFDASYAEKMGLVHYVAQTEKEMVELEEYIGSLIFAAAPGAIADAKKLVDDVSGRAITDTLGQETAKRIASRRASDEGREGLSAFLEKRKPDWAK
jgi:methylglutaconyl-CoA hydratase